jgi:hypothetical protein
LKAPNESTRRSYGNKESRDEEESPGEEESGRQEEEVSKGSFEAIH